MDIRKVLVFLQEHGGVNMSGCDEDSEELTFNVSTKGSGLEPIDSYVPRLYSMLPPEVLLFQPFPRAQYDLEVLVNFWEEYGRSELGSKIEYVPIAVGHEDSNGSSLHFLATKSELDAGHMLVRYELTGEQFDPGRVIPTQRSVCEHICYQFFSQIVESEDKATEVLHADTEDFSTIETIIATLSLLGFVEGISAKGRLWIGHGEKCWVMLENNTRVELITARFVAEEEAKLVAMVEVFEQQHPDFESI